MFIGGKAMAKSEVSYEVKKNIGKLGEDSKKELRIVSWNGREAKLDIREWYMKDGEERCAKGIGLTSDEAKELIKLLNEYLNEDAEDEDF